MTIIHHARLLTASALSLSLALSPLALDLAIAQTATTQQPDTNWEKEFSVWRAASKAGTVAEYQAYLKAYPSGKFAKVAQTRIEQLSAKTEDAAKADTTAKVDDAAKTAPAEDQAATEQAPAEDAAKTEDTAKTEEAAPAEDEPATAEAPAEDEAQPPVAKIAPKASDPAIAGAPEKQADPAEQVVQQADPNAKDGDQSAWEQEYALWKAAAQGNTVVEYQSYIKEYPDGKFAAIAQSRIAALKAAEAPAPNVAEGDEQTDEKPVETMKKKPARIKPADQQVVEEQPEAAPEDQAQVDEAPVEEQDPGQEEVTRRDQAQFSRGTPDTEYNDLDDRDHPEIQGRLTSLGYDTYGVDGVFGPNTREAIAGWQRDNGAPVSGYLVSDQIDAIREQSRTTYADWLDRNPPVAVYRPQRIIRDDPVYVEPRPQVIIRERIRPQVIIRERIRPRVVIRERVRPQIVIKERRGKIIIKERNRPRIVIKNCRINKKGRRVCG